MLDSSIERTGRMQPPEPELQEWYQYYFATERGRDGYDANRREYAKLTWRSASAGSGPRLQQGDPI
jgi:hypothetical protein